MEIARTCLAQTNRQARRRSTRICLSRWSQEMVCAYTPTPHHHELFGSMVSAWEEGVPLCPGEEAGPQGPFDRYAFC